MRLTREISGRPRARPRTFNVRSRNSTGRPRERRIVSYPLENPDAARDALLEANEELDPETIEETLELVVPIFGDEGEQVGYQDPEEWRVYVDWAVENGVLPDPIEVKAVTTNEFLSESQEKT